MEMSAASARAVTEFIRAGITAIDHQRVSTRDCARITEFNDKAHFHNTYEYVRERREPGTIVWSHRDDENWIDHSEVGIIVMALRRKQIRVFARAHTPASERQRRPG